MCRSEWRRRRTRVLYHSLRCNRTFASPMCRCNVTEQRRTAEEGGGTHRRRPTLLFGLPRLSAPSLCGVPLHICSLLRDCIQFEGSDHEQIVSSQLPSDRAALPEQLHHGVSWATQPPLLSYCILVAGLHAFLMRCGAVPSTRTAAEIGWHRWLLGGASVTAEDKSAARPKKCTFKRSVRPSHACIKLRAATASKLSSS